MINGGLINVSGKGSSGGGGPFAFFASAQNYALPNGGGSVTLNYNSQAGGLALILVDAEFQVDAPNAASYDWTVKVDGAGGDITPCSHNNSMFWIGGPSNANLSTFPGACHKSFVATLPAGAHTLVLNIANTFGAAGYFLGAAIKAFYN